MNTIVQFLQEANELQAQITAECQTTDRAQALRKKFEELRKRSTKSISELKRIQSEPEEGQELGIESLRELIDQSFRQIDEKISRMVESESVMVGEPQTSTEQATATEVEAQQGPSLQSGATDAPPNGQTIQSTQTVHVPLASQTTSETEQSQVASEATASTSETEIKPVFELKPIVSPNDSVKAQMTLLNQILEKFNQLANGTYPGQKPTSNTSDDATLGGPLEDVHSIVKEFKAQSKETAEMLKNVEKIEKTVAENLPQQLPFVQLKLDKIQMPTFDGDLTNWISFRDQYLELVHNNPKLTPITKFYQLKSHLKGLALDAINGFKLSAVDYEPAWFVLMKRYNRPDQIIDEYIRKFEALPYLTTANAVGLIKMVNAVNQLTRVLPNLGVDVSSWDKWLIFNLKARLDKITLRKWMDQVKLRQDVKLSELLEFIECQAAECLPSEAEKTRPHPYESNKKFKKNKMKHATSMVVTTAAKCKQCGGDHPIYRCPTFKALSVPDRIKKIKASKLCIRCLQDHQHPADCKFGACPTCAKDHNSLLCLKKDQPKKESDTAGSSVVA